MSPHSTPDGPREAPALLRALNLLRERWWVVALAALVCAGAALAVSLSKEKQYDASSQLLFRKSGLSNAVTGTSVNQPSLDPERDSTTNTLLVQSNEVAERVRRALALATPADQLSDKLTVSSESNSDIITVTVRDPNPRRAARLSTAFSDQYVLFRKEQIRSEVADGERFLRARINQLPPDPSADGQRQDLRDALSTVAALGATQTGDVTVVDRAEVPTTASVPTPRRDVIIALLLGLALGVAIAFLLDFLDRRIKTIEAFERIYGLRALASIPQRAFEADSPEKHLSTFEPYRILSNSLGFASFSREVNVLLVTSASGAEGKTTVAANLARAVALSGQRVILAELDLRRPSFGSQFELDTSQGLTTTLMGRRSLDETLRPAAPDMPNLLVLPSGPLPPNTAELLQTRQMSDLLVQLRERSDLVILDAPPLLPVADAQVMLDHPQVDACIIVARAHQTTRDDARRARAIVELHRLAPLGIVVTGVRERSTDYYGPAEQPRDSFADQQPPAGNGSSWSRSRSSRERKVPS